VPAMAEESGKINAAELLKAPSLPSASPIADIACPFGLAMSPMLTTPQWICEASNNGELKRTEDKLERLSPFGSLGQVDQWAWEMGSEAGSMPSAWSKPSTKHSSAKSCSAEGDGLNHAQLLEAQRLSYVKPPSVSASGGRVIVGLRKEVPQGYWDHIEIILVCGPAQVKIKPTGIKKGKKLCVEVPGGLQPGDYDVRLVFAQKMLHGAISLVLHGDTDDLDPEEEEYDS